MREGRIKNLGYQREAANEHDISPYLDELKDYWEELLWEITKEKPEYLAISQKIRDYFLNAPEWDIQNFEFWSITRFWEIWIIQNWENNGNIIAQVKLWKNKNIDIDYENQKYSLDFSHWMISNKTKHSWNTKLWNKTEWTAKVSIKRVNNLIEESSINIIEVLKNIVHTQKEAKILFSWTAEERLSDTKTNFKSKILLEDSSNWELRYHSQKNDERNIEEHGIAILWDNILVNWEFFGTLQVDSWTHLGLTWLQLLDSIVLPLWEKKTDSLKSISQRVAESIWETLT